jgi:hypothetical protein
MTRSKTPTVPKGKDATEQDLTVLETQAAKWRELAAAKARQVSDLEAQIGAEVLAAAEDSATADALAARLARLRAERDTAKATMAAAETAIQTARRRRLAAVADDLRARTEGIEAEIASRGRRVDELLAELATVDGARYVVPGHERTTRDVLRADVEALRGMACVLDAAAVPGSRVSVGTSVVDGAVLWSTATVVGAHLGDDATMWAARVLGALAAREPAAAAPTVAS